MSVSSRKLNSVDFSSEAILALCRVCYNIFVVSGSFDSNSVEHLHFSVRIRRVTASELCSRQVDHIQNSPAGEVISFAT